MANNKSRNRTRQRQNGSHPGGGDQDKPKILRFKGHSFRLPDSAEGWDLNAAVAFEQGQAATAMKGILGAESWARLTSLGATLGDLDDLAQQVGRLYGFETAGESAASSD